MDSTNFVIAMFKATNEENQHRLFEILKKQIPTLRKYELIRSSPAFMLQSQNGTIIVTYEWESEKAKQVAHEHPAIRTIWGELEGICEFTSLSDLPESKSKFPNFKVLERY